MKLITIITIAISLGNILAYNMPLSKPHSEAFIDMSVSIEESDNCCEDFCLCLCCGVIFCCETLVNADSLLSYFFIKTTKIVKPTLDFNKSYWQPPRSH